MVLSSDSAEACKVFHQECKNIADEINELRNRKPLRKVATCLKLYKEGIREKFDRAFRIFDVRMKIHTQLSLERTDTKVDDLVKKLQECSNRRDEDNSNSHRRSVPIRGYSEDLYHGITEMTHTSTISLSSRKYVTAQSSGEVGGSPLFAIQSLCLIY